MHFSWGVSSGFSWGAVLLAYVTAQRLAELWWARQNETRLVAAGGVEYGRSHLRLMQLLHAVWLTGMWLLAYDRSVQPTFLALFVVLQIGRFWVLCTLGQRWTIRVIVIAGEKLVASGPYRWLRHPNYAIVIGEIAVVPLALGMPFYALAFSLLNAILLSIRIPQESAALAVNALNRHRK
jgi:methyltransferase